MKTKVVIPFRQREGGDMLRSTNLDVVHGWWWSWGFDAVIQSDDGQGSEQFNRHRAFNLAVERFPETEVFVFAEADMLIHPAQINDAVQMAKERPGLVVPFMEYRYLSRAATLNVQDAYFDDDRTTLAEWWSLAPTDPRSIFGMQPESMMVSGDNIGSVSVVSRDTLDLTGGFTELTRGVSYDDLIVEEAFAYLTGSGTRWVGGPSVHLYHDPGRGPHRTDVDRAASQRNKMILRGLRSAIQEGDREAVKQLMSHRTSEEN